MQSGCLRALPVGWNGLLLSLTTVLRSVYIVSTYVALWLRAVCIFCVFHAVEYVVAAWRCSWALLACFWGGRGDVVVVGRSGVLWVVGSSWWFSAFSTAAVGCGDALPQVPLSLGSSRGWGGEGTGGIRRRVGGRPPQAVQRF